MIPGETSTARRCTGRCSNGTIQRCETRATLVCTAPDGLQWYACERPEHSAGATTEPIDQWFARILAEPPTFSPMLQAAAERMARPFDFGPGVTDVATTFAEPGELQGGGCPIHGAACPRSCPVLQAAEAYAATPDAPTMAPPATVDARDLSVVVRRALPENVEPEPMPNPAIGERTAEALHAYLATASLSVAHALERSRLPLNAFAVGVNGDGDLVVRLSGLGSEPAAFLVTRDGALNLVAWLSVLAEIDDATLRAARRLVEST